MRTKEDEREQEQEVNENLLFKIILIVARKELPKNKYCMQQVNFQRCLQCITELKELDEDLLAPSRTISISVLTDLTELVTDCRKFNTMLGTDFTSTLRLLFKQYTRTDVNRALMI